MSILPAYLCSFSNVSSHQRGVSERMGLERLERNDSVDGLGKIRKTPQNPDENNERSRDSLIVRSGDVVSEYGDVFSSSRTERSEQSTQNQQSKGVTDEKLAQELTDEEQLQVTKLKQRDAEVKAHEAAHLGAAGGLARGGASYEYQKGPDGNSYAVGGEVSIDSSPVEGDPQATIAKAQQIRSAALAPANPSSQDYKVASQASRIEAQARQELAKNAFDGQESSVSDENQKSGDTDKTTSNQTSQYSSQRAVMKYVAHSQSLAFQAQAGFRGFA